MGVTKTQDRARSTFFWVGISKEIENVIGNCEVCQKYAKRQPKECQGHVQDISEAWESTATDLFEFKGNTYLIISCRFSGYMAIRDMKDHSAEETIKQCQSIFRELGVPKTLHCDRGSNYTSVQFQEFAKSINMNLTFGSSEHHSSNYAERSIQTVKNFMRKSKEWSICLLEYHMTPIRHQGAESSPIRLMQQRTIRGILPVRQQETNSNYEQFRTRKLEQSQYETGQNLPTLPIGSSVLYYSAVRNQWSPGVIVERVHDRSYTVISQKGRMLSRNRVDLKPYQLYHANISARHQILSTKRDPLPRARIYHLRPVHDKTNLKLNVNQRQNKIQKMYLCQTRPGAAEQCACLAGTGNEFLCETSGS